MSDANGLKTRWNGLEKNKKTVITVVGIVVIVLIVLLVIYLIRRARGDKKPCATPKQEDHSKHGHQVRAAAPTNAQAVSNPTPVAQPNPASNLNAPNRQPVAARHPAAQRQQRTAPLQGSTGVAAGNCPSGKCGGNKAQNMASGRRAPPARHNVRTEKVEQEEQEQEEVEIEKPKSAARKQEKSPVQERSMVPVESARVMPKVGRFESKNNDD